jgi:hypothetical protein
MKNRLLKYLTGLLFMGLGTVLMLKSELGWLRLMHCVWDYLKIYIFQRERVVWD